MSDRIVLMRQGRIEQIGSPRELYDRPVSRYVADFIGETNLLAGIVVESGPHPVVLQSDDIRLSGWSDAPLPEGSAAWLSVRPEAVEIDLGAKIEPAANRLEGRIIEAVYVGSLLRVHVLVPGERRFVIHAPAGTSVQIGGTTRIFWKPERGRCGSE
jgi:ABC-type Fe3+/spermidine/putrescine transport system ATPase subunit